MYRKSHRTLGLLALALSTSLGRAEDPRFGVQVHGNIPTGNLQDAVDNKLGLGLGAHGTFDLGLGHVIRPRFDYTFFPEVTLPSGTSGLESQVDNLSIGADYLYFVDGKPVGLYVTGGLSINHWKVKVGDASDSSNKLGFAVGAGYNFNRSFGAELRFTTSQYGSGSKDLSANAFQAGITFRF